MSGPAAKPMPLRLLIEEQNNPCVGLRNAIVLTVLALVGSAGIGAIAALLL